MRVVFAAGLALATLILPATAQSLTGAQVGQIFCMAMTSQDDAPLRGILSPDLAAIIADAEVRSAAIEAAAPDEKPPLGDGIPWQAAPDYAKNCTVVGMSGTFDLPEVILFYEFPEEPSANYSDRVVLRFIDERLRVEDVKYANDAGTLREALVGMFEGY